MLRMPIKVAADRVVTLGDVAEVRRTFKDPEGFARVDGRSALALEVKKRIGRNIIETIEQVRAVVEAERARWPATRRGRLPAGQVRSTSATMLDDLGNNVLTAVALTMIITVAMLGLRSSLLVGLAVPVSFLFAMAVLGTHGPHGQHRRPVLADPGRRHAGRRGHGRGRVCRPQDGRGPLAARGLPDGGRAHVLAGDRQHRHGAGGLPAAPVLARHRRRVHALSADHAGGHAPGLAGHGHGVRAGTGRHVRPCRQPGRGGAPEPGRHRERRPRRRARVDRRLCPAARRAHPLRRCW